MSAVIRYALGWKQEAEVSEIVRRGLEEVPVEDVRARDLAELRRFGRVLTVGERLAVERHERRHELTTPEIHSITPLERDAVNIVKDEEYAGRTKCYPCCVAYSFAKVGLPISVVGMMLTLFDWRSGRTTTARQITRNMAGFFLPAVIPITAGSIAFTETLYSARPLDEGNYTRALKAWTAAATLFGVVPFVLFTAGRGAVRRYGKAGAQLPSSVRGLPENEKFVKLRQNEWVGHYKSCEELTAVDMALLGLAYALSLPLLLFLAASSKGDAVLLRRGDGFTYACVPRRLQDRLRLRQIRATQAAGGAIGHDVTPLQETASSA